MEVKQVGDIHEIQGEHGGSNWEQYFFLCSDIHYDSIDCDRKLLKKHFNQAKERNAPILIFGDLMSVIGCAQDPRSSKLDVRPEYNVAGYLGAVRDDVISFLKDYDVAFVSDGNHEENITSRHEIDLIGDIANALGCARGLYDGFLRFAFRNNGETKRHMDMYFNHGGGGNSPVTKGVISTNRRSAHTDADIFVSGHNHNRWNVETMRRYVDKMGTVKTKAINHINMGTYEGTPPSRGRFHSNFGAPNMGGVWLRFFLSDSQRNLQVQVVNA